MRTFISILAFSAIMSFFFACKKNKADTPPVTVADSTFKITDVRKKEIDEYLVACQIIPPSGKTVKEALLDVSKTTDFSDSIVSIFIRGYFDFKVNKELSLNNLEASTTYYVRMQMTIDGQKYYSTTRQFKTDSLQIMSVDYRDLPVYFNRSSERVVMINLPILGQSNLVSKIYLNNYQCTVKQDFGGLIKFDIPSSVPFGRYKLRLERNKMKAETIDSVFIVKGEWKFINNFPAATSNYGSNTHINFGTCQSGSRGYIVGGRNSAYTQDASGNVYDCEDYILEYNPSTTQWAKIIPTNPKYIQDPISYYYNNSIYIIGGFETSKLIHDYLYLSKIYRFNLTTRTWTQDAPIGYPARANAISFELNGEWYIGLGNDQMPNPAARTDFYKYNPGTNVWTRLADFPGTFYQFSSNFVLGSKAYLFYGEALNNQKELWEYDPALDKWTKLNIQIPVERGSYHSIVTLHGKAYFLTSETRYCGVGGCSIGLASPLFWEFDPSNNLFSRIATPAGMNLNIFKTVFQSTDKVIMVDNMKYSQIATTSTIEFRADN